MNQTYDVVIIGAGIVGAATALQAQQAGHRIALLDRDEAGSGASFGNAGTFADYGCTPINSPSLPLQVPGMLIGDDSPLAVRWRYLPRMLPWLWRFLVNCQPSRVRAISEALVSLLSRSEAATSAMLKMAAAEDLVFHRGCIYLCSTERGRRNLHADLRRRKGLGVAARLLSAAEIHELEPRLAVIYQEGMFFERARHTVDPQALVQRLTTRFAADGGSIIHGHVNEITVGNEQTIRVQCMDKTLVCRQLVIAAGAWSKHFLGTITESVPLETERGYHVCFGGGQGLLQRPIGWAEKGFYMTPMTAGLRAAGTVELGGLELPASPKRMDYIERNARRLLPDLEVRTTDWLGFRPSLPDALPVIGRSTDNENIIFAFGHQHLGLTLAAITGQIVTRILGHESPELDISVFSPSRFQ